MGFSASRPLAALDISRAGWSVKFPASLHESRGWGLDGLSRVALLGFANVPPLLVIRVYRLAGSIVCIVSLCGDDGQVVVFLRGFCF